MPRKACRVHRAVIHVAALAVAVCVRAAAADHAGRLQDTSAALGEVRVCVSLRRLRGTPRADFSLHGCRRARFLRIAPASPLVLEGFVVRSLRWAMSVILVSFVATGRRGIITASRP